MQSDKYLFRQLQKALGDRKGTYSKQEDISVLPDVAGISAEAPIQVCRLIISLLFVSSGLESLCCFSCSHTYI